MNQTIKKTHWNENFWDKTQTKSIQGLCAIGIVFHHMAQKTCAPWLPQEYIVHGLEPFLYLGYLFVGIFFFCSGYGLYKSIKEKPDYLKGFIGNHYRPLIFLYIISQYCYYMVGNVFSQYVWFIYAIMYLYLAFYISFKCFKNEKASIISLALFILLYVIICEALVAGGWCYNTIGVFFIGLLFAKYTDRIVAFIRKKYVLCLILCFFIMVAGYYGAIQFNKQIYLTNKEVIYNLWRYSTVIVQFIASTAFAVFLFILSQKIRLQGKVLNFLGSITLELYLIHVLFVETFGYCFVNIDIGAICYIKNIVLYSLVVLSLSLISAYLLRWAKTGAHYVYVKCRALFAKMKKDFKKVLIIICCIFAGFTLLLIVINISSASSKKEMTSQFIDENITFIDIDADSKMAAYITGEGTKTVVILRGYTDPCPTISQKALADELSSDFKVVVLDFMGTGFSRDAKTERNIQNICSEIHKAVSSLGLNDYIMIAEKESGYYAQYYVNEYPKEVTTVLTIEADFAGFEKENIELQNASIFDYKRQRIKRANALYFGYRALYNCGYYLVIWPAFEELYQKSAGQKYADIISTIFFKNVVNKSIRDEMKQSAEHIIATQDLKYPAEVKVIDLVNDYKLSALRDFDIDLSELLAERCENKANQQTLPIIDGMYCITFNPASIKEIILSNQNQ